MTHVVNLGALLLALALSLLAVGGLRAPMVAPVATTPDGGFQRIVSLGLVADAALGELCEPARVVAVSAWSEGPLARRWQGLPRLSGLDDLEAVIALRPDLVLVSTSGEDARLARLRAAGIRVADLGPMRGVATWCADLELIGGLLGRGDEARASAARLRARMARVAPDDGTPRPRALYVATYGGTLFGGTVGTSFHDVLSAAGCADVAAATYRDWPQYGVEQVVLLHPDVLVTRTGMGATLRALPGMAALAGARVVELDGQLLDDPGPRLLEAAETLREALRPVVAPGPPAGAEPAGPGTTTSR